MSNRYNNAGREIVADRFIALKGGGLASFQQFKNELNTDGIRSLGLRIVGPREVDYDKSIPLSASVFDTVDNKPLVAYDNDNFYSWSAIGSDWTAKGQAPTIAGSVILDNNGEPLTLICTMNNGSFSLSSNYIVSLKFIKQYTWSVYSDYDSFKDEPHEWSNVIGTSDKPFLWTRESNNGGLDYEYYRVTGADGWSTAYPVLYRKQVGEPAPFTGELTYTFSTGSINGTDLQGWSVTIPDGDGDVYVTQGIAKGQTDTVPIVKWTQPAILSQEGTQGPVGPSAVQVVADFDGFTFSANSSGVVHPSGYNTFICGVKVSQDGTAFVASSVLNGKSQFNVTVTSLDHISNVIVSNNSQIRFEANTGDPWFDTTQDYASIKYSVAYRDVNGNAGSVDKTITLNKSKEGYAGAKTVYMYKNFPNTENVTIDSDWSDATNEYTPTEENQIAWVRTNTANPPLFEIPPYTDINWSIPRPVSADYKWIVRKDNEISELNQTANSIAMLVKDTATGEVTSGDGDTVAGITISKVDNPNYEPTDPNSKKHIGNITLQGNVVAEDTLFTKTQKIQNGGIIYGGEAYYADGTPTGKINPNTDELSGGVYIGADGQMKATSADFINCSVNKLISEPFTTITKPTKGRPIHTDDTIAGDYYYWKNSEFYAYMDKICDSGGPITSFPVTMTDGKTGNRKSYTGSYYNPSQGGQLAININQNRTSSGSMSFRALKSCTIHIFVRASTALTIGGRYSYKKNGAEIKSGSFGTGGYNGTVIIPEQDMSLNAGDYIETSVWAQYQSTNSGVIFGELANNGSVILQVTYAEYLPAGFNLRYDNKFLDRNIIRYLSDAVSCPKYGVEIPSFTDKTQGNYPVGMNIYSSYRGFYDDNKIKVAPSEYICNPLSSYIDGTYDDISYTKEKISRIKIYDNSCEISFADSEKLLFMDTSHYGITFSVIINTYQNYVSNLTKDILPKANNTYYLGKSENRFAEINATKTDSLIIINHQNDETYVSKVWGAVAN